MGELDVADGVNAICVISELLFVFSFYFLLNVVYISSLKRGCAMSQCLADGFGFQSLDKENAHGRGKLINPWETCILYFELKIC